MKQPKFVHLIKFLILLVVLIVSSCSTPKQEQPCPKYTQSSDVLPNMPDFIPRVWPVPDSHVSLTCYNQSKDRELPIGRGVGAVVRVDPINLAASERSDPPYEVVLYVDDQKVLTNTVVVMGIGEMVFLDKNLNATPTDITGSYRVSWLPQLKAGEHRARIEISREGEEIRHYEWSFTITK